jgi:hypothetical protein
MIINHAKGDNVKKHLGTTKEKCVMAGPDLILNGVQTTKRYSRIDNPKEDTCSSY